jgi:tetratricopeptide (TPR) repeat protein
MPGRRSSLSVVAGLTRPWVVGVIAAVTTALGLAINAFALSLELKLAIVVVGTMLTAAGAWATQYAIERMPQDRPELGGAQAEVRVVPAQLPPPIDHFTGREDSLRALHAAFGRERGRRPGEPPTVVSIYGPGGVGKSSLATRFGHEIAARYPDGRLYHDLRGAADAAVRPADVLVDFLLAMGVRLATDPGGLEELKKLWWTWLQDRRVLIFLDNARDHRQVRPLLPPEGGCAVIVTSRAPLFLGGTHDQRLTEFSTAQAVTLLARLAGDDRVAADVAAAERIAELCDRLPLAVSICGGRLAVRPHWSLAEMVRRLSEARRLDELELSAAHGETAYPIESVRSSLRLSYADCTPVQQRLLRMFGVLTVPDLPAWAAGALLEVPELDGADQLEALVDTQLLECTGADATGALRYKLHDLVRLYARERAEQTDDPAHRRAAVERVLAGYSERAEAAAAARWPQDWQHRAPGSQRLASAAAGRWFPVERLVLLAGIRQAVELEMWEYAWRLGRAFCSLCHSMRVFWQDWVEVAQITHTAACKIGDRRSLGIALLERASAAGNHGLRGAAVSDAQAALEIFEELAEPWWIGRALRTLGMSLRDDGNLDDGQEYLAAAIASFETAGDRWWKARTQRNLAELRLRQYRYEEARELLEQAQRVFHQAGHRYSEAQTLRVQGEVLGSEGRDLLRSGDLQGAQKRFGLAAPTLERAAETFRERREYWEQARCLRSAGEVGDPSNGLREHVRARSAKEMLEALGDSWGVARTLISEGLALSRLARIDEAAAALREAADAFEALGDRWLQARSLRTLAEVLLNAGRTADARNPAEQAVEIYSNLGNGAGEQRARRALNRAQQDQPSS